VEDKRSTEFPRGYHNDNYAEQAFSFLKKEQAPSVPFPERQMNWDFKQIDK
jgi:hypothetical protein